MTEIAIRSSWVLVNGIRTHYSEAGDKGPAVILCHGGGPGVSGYAGFRFMLPALAPQFRVYAIDQLSFGYTDTRPHAWPVNGHQSLVDHVAGFIEALCLDEVMLAGNSQGAYVALKCALDHPEKVKKLFLIASGTIGQAMGIPMPDSPGLRAIGAFDGSAAAMRRFLEGIVLNRHTITDEIVNDRVTVANRPGAPEARRAFNEARGRMGKDPNWQQRFDLRGRLPQMTIPTRFVWGKEDNFAPMEMGKKLEALLPNIPFSYIDDAGHQCQTDQPDVVNRMIREFFST